MSTTEIITRVENDGNIACEMHNSDGSRGYEAVVIADSIHDGDRITTLACRFPRFILPEINTHRVFSRNSASSRARGMKTTIREVMENPFVPDPFTGDKKGMQGDDGSKLDQGLCREIVLNARDEAVATVLSLFTGTRVTPEMARTSWEDILDSKGAGNSVHKQHANRYIEPFAWHTALITSDNWDNFFDLRIHPGAQPEIQRTALTMRAALDASTPDDTDIHLPFVHIPPVNSSGELGDLNLDVLLPVSAARCARTSYRLYTGAVSDVDSDLSLARKLLHDFHMSPFEHIAFKGNAVPDIALRYGVSGGLGPFHGNFSHWYQLRKFLETSRGKI